LGLLVTGAEKVEREVEQLKRNFRSLSRSDRTGTVARIGPSLNTVRASIERTRNRIGPVNERIRPLRDHLEFETKTLLNSANVRSRILLLRTLDRTIVELEKARQRLDVSRGHAS
jgi:hypothetical protein